VLWLLIDTDSLDSLPQGHVMPGADAALMRGDAEEEEEENWFRADNVCSLLEAKGRMVMAVR
jgi:hypothetical protein